MNEVCDAARKGNGTVIDIDCVLAIICMYAIFNFYGDDRKLAIGKMYDSLCSSGVAVINARKEMHTEIKYAEDWCGQPMWWDLPGVDTIISEFIWAGFEMDEIWDNIDNSDYVFIKFSKN